MGKKVDVTLAFNADTGKAKSQIQELQSLLNKISYSGATASQSSANAKNLREAADAAKDLAYHLNNAYNNKTGKFDLSLFDKSLKSSNQNLTGLSTKLMSAGKTGQDAFVKLAQSISKADQPMFKLSTRMQDFAKTMKNTIKWQLSSSMLHSFMGAVQSAYGYAKNLNASLNDIRIVTGQSADQMAAFAEQANKAAKRLSTTTTDYTKSSLIYFQQGLDAEEVRKRTEVTIKMANVAGTTAQTVSDQMTAVWNNFYDGGKSLEYYSDVMVALGAATASSTDEISEGVNKFAAAAKTVGLSYEYATAALATITAKTRESADIVGNALKTIFSRIQGLNLGETLDDGTTLNKYSKALDAVGISIKTTDGQLKDMNTILDEMGAKWQTLGKDQQMALAQTVAGVRQYAQLIALMNNYDYFKQNLNIAYGAEGTLKKQADVYAESWEAAEKRVKASMQGIYQSLIDDKFFIGVNNALADALSGLDAFIDAAGGLPTVLTTIGSIFLSVFANKMPEAFKNLKYNFDVFTKGANAAYKNIVEEMKTATKQGYDDYAKSTGTQGIDPNSSSGYALQAASDLTIARSRLAEVNDQLNSSEQQRYNTELGLIDQQQQEIVGLKQKAEALQEIITTLENEFSDPNNFDITDKIFGSVDKIITESLQEVNNYFAEIKADYDDFGRDIQQVGANYVKTLTIALREGKKGTIDLTKDFKILTDQMKNFNFKNLNTDNFEDFKNQIMRLFDAIPNGIKNVSGLSTALREVARAGDVSKFTESYQKLIGFLQKDISVDSSNIFKALRGSVDAADLKKLQESYSQLPKVQREVEEGQQRINQALAAFQPTHAVQGIEAIASAASAMTGVVNILNQLKGLSDAFTNPDLTGWERFSEILSSIGFMVPSIVSVLKSIGTVTKWQSDYAAKILGQKTLQLAEEKAIEASKQKQTLLDILNVKYKGDNTKKTKEMVTALLQAVGLEANQANINALTAKLKAKNVDYEFQKLAANKNEVAAAVQELAVEKGITKEKQVQAQLSKVQSFLTNPLSFIAVATVIIALIAAIVKLIGKQKDTAKAFEEANQAYEEQKSKVDELNTKLNDLNKTIDKLRNKGPLTLVEQEQLNKAEVQKAITEQQLKLEQQLFELRQQSAVDTFVEKATDKKNWPSMPRGRFITDKNGNTYLVPSNFTNENSLGEIVNQESTSVKYAAGWKDAESYGGGTPEDAAVVIAKIIEHLGLDENTVKENGLLEQNGYGYYSNFENYMLSLKDSNSVVFQDLADWISNNLFMGMDSGKWLTAIASNGIFKMSENITYSPDEWADLEKQLNEIVKENTSDRADLLAKYKDDLTNFQNLYQAGAFKNRQDQMNSILEYLKEYQDYLWGTDKSAMYKEFGVNKKFENSANYRKVFSSMLSGDNASQIEEAFDENFKNFLNSLGMDISDYAQYLFNKMQNITIANPDLAKEVLNSSKFLANPEYFNYIEQVLQNSNIKTFEQVFAELDRLIAEASQGVKQSTEDWKKASSNALSIAENLKSFGDTITADQYSSLSKEYQEYFDLQNNGTARLKKSAEEFYQAVLKGEEQNIKDQITDTRAEEKRLFIKQNAAIVDAQVTRAKLLGEQAEEIAKKNTLIDSDTAEKYSSILNDQQKTYDRLKEKREQNPNQEFSNYEQNLIDSFEKAPEELIGAARAMYQKRIERQQKLDDFLKADEIEKNIAELQAKIDIIDAESEQTLKDYNATKEQLLAQQLALADWASTVEELEQYRNEGWLDQLDDTQYGTQWELTLAKQASALGKSYDQVKAYANELGRLDENIGLSSQELDKLALSLYKISEGQEAFQTNWDKWNAAVQEGNIAVARDYLGDMQTALKKFYNTTVDLSSILNANFFIENWKLIEKAIHGDAEAAQDLLDIINELLLEGQKITAPNFAAMGGIPVAKQETKTWRSGYDERSKIISGLTEDQTITVDDYNKLLTEQQELFRVLDDGTYILNDNLGSAEENLAKLHEFEIQAAEDAGQNIGLIANSLRELDGMLASGRITEEQYKDAFDTVYGKDISKYGFDKDEVDDYAKTLQEVNKALANQPQLARKIALEEKKQVKAVKDLQENYSDYVKVLAEANKNQNIESTEKYSKVIGSLRKDLSLLTGMEEKAFEPKIINSDEMQAALQDVADGVDGAVEKLKALAVISELKVKIQKDEETWNQLYTDIAAISADNTIEIGTIVNNDAALQGLYDLMMEAGMTAEQIQERFNDLGWDPQLSYKEMTVDEAAANGSYTNKNVWVPNADGFGWHQVELTDAATMGVSGDTVIRVPVIGNGGNGGFKKIDPPNKASSSNKKSSGGGGGSSKHAEKKNDSDKERYHTVLNQLEDLNAEYDDISKAKDRAFGKDRIDYMDAEIKKTDELIAKQGEYLDQIKNYLPVDKAVLEATYKDLIGGPEMLFDEKGNISNFDAIQDAMYAKYNEMTQKFTEDDTNWEIFQKQYEQLEKYLDKYEETYDLLRDEEQKYQDLINQRIDAQLEKVQYKVEVKLDVSKDEVAVLEYQLGRIDDDAFKSIDAIDLLVDKSVQLKKQIEINKQGLNDALALSLSAAEISEVMAGNMSVLEGKNFTDEQVQAIKDYRDNLLSLNEELDDIRENIESKVLETFDAWNEKLSTGVDIIDSYSSALDHFKNIVDIVGQDVLGLDENFMQGLSQTAVDNSINKVKATKAAMESTMAAQERAQRSLEKARAQGDEKSQKMWEDTLKQLDEDARSAQDTFLQAWEDALNSLADQFEQTVNRVVQNFNKTIYNLGGLEGLANDFSRQKEDSDMMLDDYQKIYELSKLSRDINKTIDDTDIISGKQKLKKLLGQVNDLQADGVKMSKYDLEYLQKTYDLRLAELELEEAQRAKNTVRLQKDSEGNWAYIYTQSTDAIDSAQQKYEDALYAMQDLSSNYIDEMSEKLINTSQEMADALAALRVQDFASLDDYYKEVERVQKQYQDRMALQEDELNKAIANNKELYDTDWMNYHNATGYKISDTENFATSFKDTLLGALMQSDTDSSNFTELLGQSVQQLTNGLMQAAETYYTNLENAMNAAGTSTNTFGEDISKVIEDIKAKSAEGAQAVEDMANQMNNAINDTMATVENWQKAYSEAMEKIIQSNLDVINSFNELIKTLGADASNVSINYNVNRGPSSAQRFATGGYTGEWGSSGKLAILDEKELILNQNDTANMLSAIQLTREIMNAIDIGANYASLGFGNLVATSLRDSKNEALEQNVHITAEFPNVNNHNEIEEALRNLINTASQYANRT